MAQSLSNFLMSPCPTWPEPFQNFHPYHVCKWTESQFATVRYSISNSVTNHNSQKPFHGSKEKGSLLHIPVKTLKYPLPSFKFPTHTTTKLDVVRPCYGLRPANAPSSLGPLALSIFLSRRQVPNRRKHQSISNSRFGARNAVPLLGSKPNQPESEPRRKPSSLRFLLRSNPRPLCRYQCPFVRSRIVNSLSCFYYSRFY